MEKSENWYKQFTDKLELSGMSPRTQEAYSRAVRLLKDHCNKDPWEITEQDNHGGYIPDLVIKKEGRIYTYYVPVEVKAVCRATQAHIDQLNRYSMSLAGGTAKIAAKILLYPSGADISLVPNDIEVIKLNRFRCK